MAICNIITGIAEISMMFLFRIYSDVFIVITWFVIILSTFQGFFEKAIQMAVPNIVSKEKGLQANSLFQDIGAVLIRVLV